MKKTGKLLLSLLTVGALIGTGYAIWHVNEGFRGASALADVEIVEGTTNGNFAHLEVERKLNDGKLCFGADDTQKLDCTFVVKTIKDSPNIDVYNPEIYKDFVDEGNLNVVVQVFRNGKKVSLEDYAAIGKYINIKENDKVLTANWLPASEVGYEYKYEFTWNEETFGVGNTPEQYFKTQVDAVKQIKEMNRVLSGLKFKFNFNVGSFAEYIESTGLVTIDTSETGSATLEGLQQDKTVTPGEHKLTIKTNDLKHYLRYDKAVVTKASPSGEVSQDEIPMEILQDARPYYSYVGTYNFLLGYSYHISYEVPPKAYIDSFSSGYGHINVENGNFTIGDIVKFSLSSSRDTIPDINTLTINNRKDNYRKIVDDISNPQFEFEITQLENDISCDFIDPEQTSVVIDDGGVKYLPLGKGNNNSYDRVILDVNNYNGKIIDSIKVDYCDGTSKTFNGYRYETKLGVHKLTFNSKDGAKISYNDKQYVNVNGSNTFEVGSEYKFDFRNYPSAFNVTSVKVNIDGQIKELQGRGDNYSFILGNVNEIIIESKMQELKTYYVQSLNSSGGGNYDEYGCIPKLYYKKTIDGVQSDGIFQGKYHTSLNGHNVYIFEDFDVYGLDQLYFELWFGNNSDAKYKTKALPALSKEENAFILQHVELTDNKHWSLDAETAIFDVFSLTMKQQAYINHADSMDVLISNTNYGAYYIGETYTFTFDSNYSRRNITAVYLNGVSIYNGSPSKHFNLEITPTQKNNEITWTLG